MYKHSCLIAVLVMLQLTQSYGIGSADSLYFRNAEDTLAMMAGRIPEAPDDKGRMQNHHAFADYFEEVLKHDDAFSYPFDSLQTVSLLYAPDNTFRIATWYVPLSGQRFYYAGFVQLPPADNAPPEVISLQDATGGINGKEAGQLGVESWYGAYYYEVIQADGMDHYILLGWKGDNPHSRLRVIEPFSIQDGVPAFGQQVFGEPWDDKWRVVFEYSARVSMSLVFEEDRVRTSAGVFPMIVFDRLEPSHRSLQGHYRFYKPEVNIFDGLYFDGSIWRFVGDVDVRMPEQ